MFYDAYSLLAHVIVLLQRAGRVSYYSLSSLNLTGVPQVDGRPRRRAVTVAGCASVRVTFPWST